MTPYSYKIVLSRYLLRRSWISFPHYSGGGGEVYATLNPSAGSNLVVCRTGGRAGGVGQDGGRLQGLEHGSGFRSHPEQSLGDSRWCPWRQPSNSRLSVSYSFPHCGIGGVWPSCEKRDGSQILPPRTGSFVWSARRGAL